jgi:hypothetical protein
MFLRDRVLCHQSMKPAKCTEQMKKISPEYMEEGSYISSSGRLDLFHVALYPNFNFFQTQRPVFEP